jgi:hypothetical protein
MNAGKAVAIMVGLWACSSAAARADPEHCRVEHPHPENGATIVAKMSVVNDGTPCVMRLRLGGNPATSLTVRGMPSSGVLASTSAGVSYTPNAGFVGRDFFDVQWFGTGFGPNSGSRNVRTKVEVTVQAKSHDPGSQSTKPSGNGG